MNALQVLSFSKSCSLTQYPTDCPDPYGKKRLYAKNIQRALSTITGDKRDLAAHTMQTVAWVCMLAALAVMAVAGYVQSSSKRVGGGVFAGSTYRKKRKRRRVNGKNKKDKKADGSSNSVSQRNAIPHQDTCDISVSSSATCGSESTIMPSLTQVIFASITMPFVSLVDANRRHTIENDDDDGSVCTEVSLTDFEMATMKQSNLSNSNDGTNERPYEPMEDEEAEIESKHSTSILEDVGTSISSVESVSADPVPVPVDQQPPTTKELTLLPAEPFTARKPSTTHSGFVLEPSDLEVAEQGSMEYPVETFEDEQQPQGQPEELSSMTAAAAPIYSTAPSSPKRLLSKRLFAKARASIPPPTEKKNSPENATEDDTNQKVQKVNVRRRFGFFSGGKMATTQKKPGKRGCFPKQSSSKDKNLVVPTEEPAVNAAPEKHLTDIITIMDQHEETNKYQE